MDPRIRAELILISMWFIALIAFAAILIQSYNYYRRIIRSLIDGTFLSEDTVYSSTKETKVSATLAIVSLILAVVCSILPITRHAFGPMLWGLATGFSLRVIIDIRKQREITFTSESLTMSKCASVNGTDQKLLRLAWTDIEKVTCDKKRKANITLNDGSQVEVRLSYMAPTNRSFYYSYNGPEEIVWRMEMHLRKAKAANESQPQRNEC